LSDVVIWHNPRCSKSREALTLLREKGIEPAIVQYLADPPSEAEIRTAIARLGGRAIDLVRTKEKLFAEKGLTKASPDEELIAAMVAHPVLIERPVVFRGRKARIGRPTEAILDIL
jgi:arsenate reductase